MFCGTLSTITAYFSEQLFATMFALTLSLTELGGLRVWEKSRLTLCQWQRPINVTLESMGAEQCAAPSTPHSLHNFPRKSIVI